MALFGGSAVSDTLPLACPVCKHNDQIQKVTAIVTAHPSSPLGKLLAEPEEHNIPAPEQPKKPAPPVLPTSTSPTYSKPSPRFGCFTILLIIGGISALCLSWTTFGLLLNIIGGYDQTSITDIVDNWPVFSGWIVLTAGSIILGVALQRRAVAKAETLNRAANAAEDAATAEKNEHSRRNYEADVETWQKTEMARYQTEMARYQTEWQQWRDDVNKANALWRLQMENWDIAYYCHRNDVVFLNRENSKAAVPPSQMMLLLSEML